jgi:hypothetical protein
MSARDSFAVWLRNLDAGEIDFKVLDDGRHILHITTDVALYVRPDESDLPAIIDGLRKLAATAGEMAAALAIGEPEPGEYNPGSQAGDEGGVSEYRYILPEDYQRGQS